MKKNEKTKLPIILTVAVLVIVLAVVLVIGLNGKDKKPSGGNNPSNTQSGSENTGNSSEGLDGVEDTEGYVDLEGILGSDDWTGGDGTSNVEKWQEGAITYGGKQYVFNNKIKTYLIMGIDKDGKVETAKDSQSGGQSDGMFLLVTDASDKTMSVISINRNTMTRIESYYKNGLRAGYKTAQICVQHGFGDGRNLSCIRAVDAVSHLFYNIPIAGYLSLRMGALPTINDAVGGVEVQVLETIKGMGVSLTKGETKTLSGKEAYAYLRWRNKAQFDSATMRLRREEQYISAFASKLKAVTNGDAGKIVDIYESIEDYIVTNIDFASLAEEITSYKYDSSRMYSVPGSTVMGEVYEEYYVDEDKFYDMIIDIFYQEVVE